MRPILTAGTAAALLLAGSALAQPATNPSTVPEPANPVVAPTPVAPAPADNAVTTRDTARPAPAVPSNVVPALKPPSNPAVKTTEGNNPGAPFAGANSFTEGQAKSRIESRGYTNVSSLTKDTQGIWRGKADKEGKSFEVSLDYQGNVVVR